MTGNHTPPTKDELDAEAKTQSGKNLTALVIFLSSFLFFGLGAVLLTSDVIEPYLGFDAGMGNIMGGVCIFVGLTDMIFAKILTGKNKSL